jgi:hypothetical protein
MKLRALFLIAALALTACKDFDATYRDCVARGACPEGMDNPGGGTSERVLAVDPSPGDLRSVVNERLTTPFTVRNVGSQTVHQVFIGDPTESHFAKQAATECSGADLAPDASCSVNIDFMIGPDAGQVTGAFRVTSADAPTVEVQLVGREVPYLTAAPAQLDFGLVNLLEQSPPQAVVVTNNSPVLTSGTITFKTNNQYRVPSGACAPLAPRQSCSAEVVYTPTIADGGSTLTIQAVLRDGGLIANQRTSVDLSGSGYPSADVAFAPAGLFVVTPPGVPVAKALRVLNISPYESSGPFGLSLLDDAGVFTLDAGECGGADLAPGASCQLAIGINEFATPNTTFAAKVVATLQDGGMRFGDLSGGVYELVPLTLTIQGDGGFVDSRMGTAASPSTASAGVECRGPGVCTAWVPRGLSLTLSAHDAPPEALFSGWTPLCAAPATPTLCTLKPTLDAGTSMTARFIRQTNPLSVFPYPGSSGVLKTFTSFTTNVDCGLTCSVSYPYTQRVTVFAYGTNGKTLQSLGGDCGGTVDCTVSMDAGRTVNATWRTLPTNMAFVSTFWTPGAGLASADTQCADDAADAGFGGVRTWVAYLSSADAGPAYDRLKTDTGWVRPDGVVVAVNRQALKDGNLRGVLGRFARGGGVYANIYTGTRADGGLGDTCDDWTSDAGTATLGRSNADHGEWTEYSTAAACAGPGYVYCFEDTLGRGPPVVQAPPPDARLGFTTVSVRDGLTTDAELEAICQNEAQDAGLAAPSTFSPYRSWQDGGSSLTRFDLKGPGYYRVDGVRWLDPASGLGFGILDQAIGLSALGSPVTGCQWRTGCGNWSINTDAGVGTTLNASVASFTLTNRPCDTMCHFICLQR